MKKNTKKQVETTTTTKTKEDDHDDHVHNTKYDCTILFVVVRGDAKYFRPNHEACPSFAKYLKEANDAGVQVLAKQVIWGDEGENELGNCYEGNLLDIKWPSEM